MSKRINKVIELWEQGQPVYHKHPDELSYESGINEAKTLADMFLIDFEHNPFDTLGLTKFIEGLKDGGPTNSGHATPTIVCTLPSNAITPEEVRYNAWQARHLLTAGVHGILHTHTRSAESVKAFVQVTRYPYQQLGREFIGEGLRGSGGQKKPAEIWGVEQSRYTDIADPWPLNPEGEIILGLKIEDRHCVANVDDIAKVPGIAFAEWGPGDMGMSYMQPDAHDPPYPDVMNEARNKIKSALEKNGIVFYSSWLDESMSQTERLDYIIDELGCKMIGVPQMLSDSEQKELLEYGRNKTGRKMPV